ncbi:molybdopterin molybdotransferase MoeA [Streptomyces sp. BE147]|uniref:molybdopterin molybdotransferase MoeA n=1 Tax=Streptomyces sp. BE147 TaxID=3002524 RepID=UPI002E783F6F|nr:molybdopterin molybdotransferase MoeA [Streptomyces sp. BE147]MEE1739940.1 molybdopterin molybdotransferase MoeA [Streptomyces sp. BE147]
MTDRGPGAGGDSPYVSPETDEEERAVEQALALVAHQAHEAPRPSDPAQSPGRQQGRSDQSPGRFADQHPGHASAQSPGRSSARSSGRHSTHPQGPPAPAPAASPYSSPSPSPYASPSPASASGASAGGRADSAGDRASSARLPHAHRAGDTPWDQARSIAARAGRTSPVAALRVPLDRALGYVLAEALGALTDLPSFDTSAMDGWAVAGPGPWGFRKDEGLLAGRGAPAPLPDGRAVRIATGARIPADATAVIRSEHAHADEAKGLLHARRDVVPGQDIRPRGQECRSGDQLLPAGTLVTPAVLGLAAAAGYDALAAVARPSVDVLVLGDELLTSGLPHDGLIRDALGPMLGPWLRAAGAEVSEPRRLGDDANALRQALTTSRADLIITTGGTAAGPVDHVHPVLAELGAELLVDGVAVRPGHPMLLARLPSGGPYLVGLPGNPLAAVSGLLTLAEPLLGGIAGRLSQEPYRALVHAEVHGHPHDTRLVPVVHRVGRAGGRDYVVPLHYNGPAMLRGVAGADGLAVVPPGGVRSGTEVDILDLPWASATPWTEGCFT